MGEEANRAHNDQRCLTLPERLGQLKHSPSNPRLLAELLGDYASVDLDFELVGFEKKRRRARAKALTSLRTLKTSAQALLSLSEDHRNLDLLTIALEDLVSVASNLTDEAGAVSRLIEAIEAIANVSLPSNLAKFANKPVSDEAISRMVLAIAIYCQQVGISFSGPPRRTQTQNGVEYPLTSESARLTDSVLRELGAPVDGKKLATHMRKATATMRNLPRS